MYQLDNDYMIQERAIDVRSKLKTNDNPSNIAEIFFKQLALRIYDYVIRNSIHFTKRSELDLYIGQDEDREEDFKRAMAEQALYIMSNGDLSLMLPNGEFDYNSWQKLRISPACKDVLHQLGVLERVSTDQELFYHQLYDPTRNW